MAYTTTYRGNDDADLNSNFFGEGGASEDEAMSILSEVLRIGLRHKGRKNFFSPARGLSPEQVALEGMPEGGTDLVALLRDVEARYLPGMPNFGSLNFFGFPDSGNSLAGISGAILADFLNVNMINSTFCSRIATQMEIAVIRWLREIAGFENSVEAPESAMELGGIAVTGGTMANYSAVLLARERAFPGTMENGITFDPSKVAVVVPNGIAHYTIAASMAWAGLGSNNIVKAPIRNYRYDLEELRKVLRQLRADGRQVIMGVTYAGDSRSMTIDDLRSVKEVFAEEAPGAWMHCDGCHGTSLLFCDERPRNLEGLREYDSVTLDPHKVLTVPYPTSFILIRETSDTALIRSQSDLIMRQAHSLGQTTPALGSKSFFSLRLWMLFKSLGREGIGRMVSARIKQAQEFESILADTPQFIQLNERNINSVVIAYLPEGLTLPLTANQFAFVSAVNREIYDSLLEEGRMYIHSFSITDNNNILGQGHYSEINVLRYMAGNPLIGKEEMLELLGYLEELGSRAVEKVRAQEGRAS